MIIAEFDQGWGPEWPAKKFENNILQKYLEPVCNDSSATVVINSTWYSQDYHATVLSKLQQQRPDRIILVAMLDAAIPQPDWFAGVCDQVLGVGYYPGNHEIDYWALMCDENMTVLDTTPKIDTAYMCLNRKPHWHRMELYNALSQRELLDRGFVSMGGEDGAWLRLLPEDAGISNMAPNAGTEQYGIANDIMSLGHPGNWARHFVNIVSETIFDIGQHGFVTEKIYKPILGMRPFFVYARGADAWLRQRGFKTYSEDFEDITNLDMSKPENIPEFLVALTKAGPTYWQQKYLALEEKMRYNKLHFRLYIDQIKQKINQGIICQV